MQCGNEENGFECVNNENGTSTQCSMSVNYCQKATGSGRTFKRCGFACFNVIEVLQPGQSPSKPKQCGVLQLIGNSRHDRCISDVPNCDPGDLGVDGLAPPEGAKDCIPDMVHLFLILHISLNDM